MVQDLDLAVLNFYQMLLPILLNFLVWLQLTDLFDQSIILTLKEFYKHLKISDLKILLLNFLIFQIILKICTKPKIPRKRYQTMHY